ncbi:MAG: hypothetical protein JXR12_05605 [Neptunomonas phycophila]|uniref:hypothetical protein n=1 Tax=Neptunomonas phycophila TaxID=1572645 RepID=UPI003B8C867E
MDIARLKKLSGASGQWKEVKAPTQTKSQATSAYNADTKNKSATDVRDVDTKADINQDVAATMDSESPEHTETAKGKVEDQHHTISVDDNGAPKVDDTTEVVTSEPDSVANESVEEGRGCITDGAEEEVFEAASCENEEDSETDSDDEDDSDEKVAEKAAMKQQQVAEAEDDFDNEDTIEESQGDIGRFQKSLATFMDMYSVTEDEARQIIYALRGGISRAAAKAMSKIFPSASISNKDELQKAASDLFDKHPELQRELMEKVDTKFETEYRSLKEYFSEARK